MPIPIDKTRIELERAFFEQRVTGALRTDPQEVKVPVNPQTEESEIKKEELKPEANTEEQVKDIEVEENPKPQPIEEFEPLYEAGQPHFKDWFWSSGFPETEPLWFITKDSLGIVEEDALKNLNFIADIAKTAAEILQSSDPKKIFKFLRERLTETPSSVVNPVLYLRRLLWFELEEKKKELKGRG